ncbi:MAG: peptidylprolyl isomerase, partial [Pirellulales bacterium]
MSHQDCQSQAVTNGKFKVTLGAAIGVLACFATALVIRQAWEAPVAQADSPPKRATLKAKPKKNEGHEAVVRAEELVHPAQLVVLADVNGEKIERPELARQCLRHFGKDVLESMINKRLISSECQRRNIGVTDAEVKDEMDRMARRFSMPTDQLLSMLREERHITPEQYAKEIIWPTVALRKLANDQLKVSQKDFDEAFDMLYGEAVQTRLIACSTAADAESVRLKALANPDEFGNLAKQYSIDTVSASSKGLIQPIHHHQGDANIERVAFALKPNDISEVVQVGDQFVILKCEAKLKPQPVDRKKVEKVLIES